MFCFPNKCCHFFNEERLGKFCFSCVDLTTSAYFLEKNLTKMFNITKMLKKNKDKTLPTNCDVFLLTLLTYGPLSSPNLGLISLA